MLSPPARCRMSISPWSRRIADRSLVGMFERPFGGDRQARSRLQPCDAPRVPSLKMFVALLTVLLAAGAAPAAVVFAVQRSHDGVPERLRSCAEDRGAFAVKASEGMASARPDAQAGNRLR